MALDQMHDDSDEKEMSFLDHLDELRSHILRTLAFALVFTVAAFAAKDFIFDTLILGPKKTDFWTWRMLCNLSQALRGDDLLCIKDIGFSLKNIGMTGQFTQHLYISFVAGIVCAFPFAIWQLWKFVKPALRPEERKHGISLILFTSLLFMMGVSFGYFFLTPISVYFMGNYQVSPEVPNEITLESYTSFITLLVVGTGLIFELPLLIYFLSKIGLITSQFLSKNRRYAIVIIIILAAIVTPPDVVSQLLLSFPLMVLYEAGIVIARRNENRRLPVTT